MTHIWKIHLTLSSSQSNLPKGDIKRDPECAAPQEGGVQMHFHVFGVSLGQDNDRNGERWAWVEDFYVIVEEN